MRLFFRLLPTVLIGALGFCSVLAAQQRLSFGSAQKPAQANQTWIVGEIRSFAFGESNKSRLTQELMAQGWVECAGQPLPRTGKFGNLFQVIGDTWGSGDGATDFYLPDLRGVFLRGWNHSEPVPPQMSPVDAAKLDRRTVGGDPDAVGRLSPRPEIQSPGTRGHSGDNVGSAQPDAMQTHKHSDPGHVHGIGEMNPKVLGYNGYGNTYTLSNTPGQAGTTLGAFANLGGPVDIQTGAPLAVSQLETRSRNVYVLYAIYVGVPAQYDAAGHVVPKL